MNKELRLLTLTVFMAVALMGCFTHRAKTVKMEQQLPLGTPQLYNPPDNTTQNCMGIMGSVSLSWGSVVSATNYNIQYYAPTLLPVTVNNYSSTMYFINGNLQCGTTYHWKVQASNPRQVGPWSPEYVFTMSIASPMLTFPADNAILSPPGVDFIWLPVPGAQNYTLEYCTSPSFMGAITSIEYTTSRPNIVLRPATQYYWHVRANGRDISSSWSAVWKFSTR